MKPKYLIFADDTNITKLIKQRLVSINLRDLRGIESDTVEIILSDTDGEIVWPEHDVIIAVWLGYGDDDSQYYDKGFFVIDETEHSGPPDQLIIRGRADNYLEQLKTPKTRSFHQQTLGQIVATIAGENELDTAIGLTFKDVKIEHIDQTEESDLNFLTRLAIRHDAVCKSVIGDGSARLRFSKRGAGEKPDGTEMDVINIRRNQADQHSYSVKGRSDYSGVRCYWNNKKFARRNEVLIGSKTKLKTLKSTLPTKEQASEAAQAEFDRLKRGTKTIELDLAHGDPSLIAEARVKLDDWRDEMNIIWIITEVEHNLDAKEGLSTHLKLEQPNSEKDNEKIN